MESDDGIARLAEQLGGTLVARRPLMGGVSADVQALDLRLADGSVETVVLRQHGAAGWKPMEEGATSTEHALLNALAERGFAVPRSRHIDLSGEVLDRPFIVIDFVQGAKEPDDLTVGLEAMARFLVQLHAVDPSSLALPARDDLAEVIGEYLPERFDAVRRLIERVGVPPATGASVLHGDYWPGNVLWRGNEIAAVIDWEDAAVGDPVADFAACRVELLYKYGPEASSTFTHHYLQQRGRPVPDAVLALWELYVTSAGLAFMDKWGLDPTVEATMRERGNGVLDWAARVVAEQLG
ncbi:MAG: phosphotransferase [Myxococcales bacterium]|nr:phosphotransferase [Myxococcales bacterium]